MRGNTLWHILVVSRQWRDFKSFCIRQIYLINFLIINPLILLPFGKETGLRKMWTFQIPSTFYRRLYNYYNVHVLLRKQTKLFPQFDIRFFNKIHSFFLEIDIFQWNLESEQYRKRTHKYKINMCTYVGGWFRKYWLKYCAICLE